MLGQKIPGGGGSLIRGTTCVSLPKHSRPSLHKQFKHVNMVSQEPKSGQENDKTGYLSQNKEPSRI